MKELSTAQLLEAIKSLRGEESRVLAELIRYLSELYQRRAYAELGYSSLFAFCREALSYSEGAAWRRVSAAKLLLDMPDLYEKIARGELSLCATSEIARVKELNKRQALARAAAGKSKREVQTLVAEALPVEKRKKSIEKVRAREVQAACEPLFVQTQAQTAPQSEVKREKLFTITLELTEQEMQEVEALQKLLSARRVKDALLTAAKKLNKRQERLASLREKRQAAKRGAGEAVEDTRAFPPVETEVGAKPSRYIPADVRHAVQKRDACQCSYVSPEGRRCSETRGLHFDHVVPFALGGESTVENLRLLCASHNRLEADKVFGADAMRRLVQHRQAGRSAPAA